MLRYADVGNMADRKEIFSLAVAVTEGQVRPAGLAAWPMLPPRPACLLTEFQALQLNRSSESCTAKRDKWKGALLTSCWTCTLETVHGPASMHASAGNASAYWPTQHSSWSIPLGVTICIFQTEGGLACIPELWKCQDFPFIISQHSRRWRVGLLQHMHVPQSIVSLREFFPPDSEPCDQIC